MAVVSGTQSCVSWLEIPSQHVVSQAIALMGISKSPAKETKKEHLNRLIFKVTQNDDLLFCVMLTSQ